MATDTLSRTFAALSHPVRRRMLARLSQGEATVQDLSRPFKISAPAITKHLKVLEKSGLVKRGRDAQWRPARLEARPMKEAVEWMERYRAEWEDRYDRLESYLKGLQKAGRDTKG